jgi:hypothetical protein
MAECKRAARGPAREIATARRGRTPWAAVSALSCLFLVLLQSPLFAAVTPDQGPRSAVIHTGERPGVRFSSGLTICDEELRNGRWVNR